MAVDDPTYLKVPNWDEFQHYSDRNPPWIKLYNNLLSDYDWGRLPDDAKGHLIGIWLIASRRDNKIPADPDWIGSQIGSNEPVDLNMLVGLGWLEPWDESASHKKDWDDRYVPPEVRQRILERDDHCCNKCGSHESLEIDHVVPVSKGGSSDPDNLQVLCTSCNRSKNNDLPTTERDATQYVASLDAPHARSRETEGETEREGEEETEQTWGTPEEWPSPGSLPKEGGRIQYPNEFEQMWEDRIRRDGKNPKKRGYRMYRKARQGGMERDEAELALEMRRREANRKDENGKRYVEQFATFFGQDDVWREYVENPDPADVAEVDQATRDMLRKRAQREGESLQEVDLPF